MPILIEEWDEGGGESLDQAREIMLYMMVTAGLYMLTFFYIKAFDINIQNSRRLFIASCIIYNK